MKTTTASPRPSGKPAARSSYVPDLWPLNSVGIPLPGPDFTNLAKYLGDDDAVQSVKVKGEDGKTRTVKQLTVGDKLRTLHRRALRESGFTMPIAIRPGLVKPVTFIPGHLWGENAQNYANGRNLPVTGPKPADVMVIGKMPGNQEVRDGRYYVGDTGRKLIEVLSELHVRGTPSWYMTNLLKFQPPDGGAIKASWVADCLPLLHQELRIVKPKYILCLGADASKAILGDKKAGVDYMEGRVVEIEIPLDVTLPPKGVASQVHKALVMTVLHPAAVVRAPDLQRKLERGLARFNMLQQGIRFDLAEKDIDHREIRTLEELEDLLVEIDADPDVAALGNWISVDAEWQGEHPVNKKSYVRLIQLAWKPKHAAAIVWREAGGKRCFCDEDGQPAEERAVALLNDFFRNKRVIGHFLVADLEWLVAEGLTEIRERFKVPLYDQPFEAFTSLQQRQLRMMGFFDGDNIPAWARTYFEGGWDTGLAGHAIEETAQLGLEALSIRYTTAPRYDIPLHEWKVAWCKERKLKAKDLEGYGDCPDDILIPYGNYDACVTLRLAFAQMPLIDRDYEGNNCRESFWESMITTMPILEMHQTGFTVDKKRIDDLTHVFMAARAAQEEKIRAWSGWDGRPGPDGKETKPFNIRSVPQVREFLFGEKYSGKRDKITGENMRQRPPWAKSLYLEPVLDTGKPPKAWKEIRESGRENEHTAGTGKTILGVLVQETAKDKGGEQAQWIRDHRFLDQVMKSVLRPPKLGKDGQPLKLEDMEEEDNSADATSSIDPATGQEMSAVRAGMRDNLTGLVFDAGLASVICSDGRVRTHLYPTTETKRWRSARPNLQNMAKRRDDDYLRMLGPEAYKHKLRSIFMASPGCVLVEADFKSAELYCMAIMSGDPTLLDHCERNQLPESDPNYYDIHSNVAVMAFRLSCPASKSGLKSIGKAGLRIAAKNVIFGVAYGRGAKAIALQCKEEGNPISVEDAQRIVDFVFQLYPGLVPFFEEAKRRATGERWLCSCFGAFRRFPWTDDRLLIGEFERQAMNYGIQSMVASCMDRAVAYVQDYRDHTLNQPDLFRLVLQIHDALILEVPYANVRCVAEEVLPVNMRDRVDIYPTTLDGRPTGKGPYHLGVDVEIHEHWGETISVEECERRAAA